VGSAEGFTNKENAIIVDEKSPEQIASAIKLLADKSFCQSLAENGKAFVEKNFNYDKIVQNFENYAKM